RLKNESFLENIVTGDEKWIHCDNTELKKKWLSSQESPILTPKPELYGKNVMVSIWWDMKGILHYEYLKNKETINAEKYGEQLNKSTDAIYRKRSQMFSKGNIILLHDNARPHTAIKTRKHLMDLNYEHCRNPLALRSHVHALSGSLIEDMALGSHFALFILQNSMRYRARTCKPPIWFVPKKVSVSVNSMYLSPLNKKFIEEQGKLSKIETKPKIEKQWTINSYRSGLIAIKIGVTSQWDDKGKHFTVTLL
ncbi:hypothetical protein A3Q56_08291, partial [Intoshia linei]